MPSGPCMMNSQTPPGRNANWCVVVVKPSGPHHRAKCFASVNARKTMDRGPPIVRVTTISRSDAAASLRVVTGLLLLELLDEFIEAVEALVPELLEPADPRMDRLEPSRVERIETLLPRLA